MTGFGKAVAETDTKKITVEIKSLNSKQMDLNTRIPQAYRSLELDIRAAIAKTLERGKADLTITVDTAGTAGQRTSLNVEAMAAAKEAVASAAARLGIPEPADWWSVLMRFPDNFTAEPEQPLSDAEAALVLDTVEAAAAALMEHRRAEGLKLEAFFTQRLEAISALLAEIPKYETERTERIRLRLADALAKVPAVEFDKGRLEQEMIFYIEKLDVNEEKQRLTQHLAYFAETMAAPTPGQGKKLGFIAQEMGREINTLGSKSNHAEMQQTVVRMKDNLEQIKEQVLNVM